MNVVGENLNNRGWRNWIDESDIMLGGGNSNHELTGGIDTGAMSTQNSGLGIWGGQVLIAVAALLRLSSGLGTSLKHNPLLYCFSF